MRPTATAVALVLGAATACSTNTAGQLPDTPPSSLPPHALAVQGPAITGMVRDTAGHPVAGAAVRVEVEQSAGEDFVDVMKAVSSVGIFCGLAGGCTPPSSSGYSARDGSFAIEAPSNNPGHDDYSLTVVVAHGSKARVGTSLTLPRAAGHGFKAGAVVVAAGSPRLTVTAGRERVLPPALPAAYRASDFSAALNVETGSPPVVDGESTTVTEGFNPLVVEDEHLLLTTGQTGGQHGRDAIFTSSLDVHGASVPASRGSACIVTGSSGQRIAQHPCGLTDGVLDRSWSPNDDPRCSDGPCPGRLQHDHRDVTLILRNPMSAKLIVVRGCGGCSVSISADGRGFAPAGTQEFGSSDDPYVVTLHGQRVAMVRVQTDTGGFFDSLREVSVFSTRQ